MPNLTVQFVLLEDDDGRNNLDDSNSHHEECPVEEGNAAEDIE